MTVGSNISGMRTQMGIAFDIPIPAGRTPDNQCCGENSPDNAQGLFAPFSKSLGYRCDDECSDKNTCCNVPEGHAAIMAPAIVNFKVFHAD